jgi:hypothetical protein
MQPNKRLRPALSNRASADLRLVPMIGGMVSSTLLTLIVIPAIGLVVRLGMLERRHHAW